MAKWKTSNIFNCYPSGHPKNYASIDHKDVFGQQPFSFFDTAYPSGPQRPHCPTHLASSYIPNICKSKLPHDEIIWRVARSGYNKVVSYSSPGNGSWTRKIVVLDSSGSFDSWGEISLDTWRTRPLNLINFEIRCNWPQWHRLSPSPSPRTKFSGIKIHSKTFDLLMFRSLQLIQGSRSNLFPVLPRLQRCSSLGVSTSRFRLRPFRPAPTVFFGVRAAFGLWFKTRWIRVEMQIAQNTDIKIVGISRCHRLPTYDILDIDPSP